MTVVKGYEIEYRSKELIGVSALSGGESISISDDGSIRAHFGSAVEFCQAFLSLIDFDEVDVAKIKIGDRHATLSWGGKVELP